MSSFAFELLSTLGRTTLWLGLVGVVTAGLLRLAQIKNPTIHRVCCVLTLLAGWAFLRYSVAVPWYEMTEAGPISGQEPTSIAVIDLQTDESRAGQADDPAPPIDIAESPLEIAGATTPKQPDANANIPQAPTAATRHLQAAAGPTSAPSISIAAWLDRWPVAVLALWAVGLLVLPAIWLVGYVRFVRSLRSCRQPVDAWQSQWSELIGSAPDRRQIPLCVSDDVGPMLCRLPRGYVLVVPEPLWRELSDEGRRAILRHEMAHYLRGDVWKSLGVRLLALPHWFNPVSWWAVRRFDEAAEWACDAAASADTRSTEYAKTLVRLGELSTAGIGYGSAARGHTLAARVRRVLDMRARSESVWKQAFALGMVLAIGLASLINVELVAREPKADEQSPPADSGRPIANSDEPSSPGIPLPEAPTRQPGPTVSPYLNLLQVESDPAKKDAVGKTSDEPGKDQELAAKDSVSQAANKMVEQAERAFEATQAAYEAETTTLEAVYGWSLRWMRAAQNTAKTPKEKAAAAQAHLARMRQLQQKIHALFQLGSRGGEAKDEAAAKYYVAEAERFVAESGAALDSYKPSGALKATLLEQQISEAKIALATDDADLLKTEARMQVAKEKFAAVTRAKPGAVAQVEIAHKKAEVQLLEAELKKLQYIRNLHEQNLVRLQAAEQQRGAEAPATAEPERKSLGSRTEERLGLEPQRKLLYAGKSFDQWAEQLRTDLSPESRQEAINALAAFGAHGMGREAADAIVAAALEYGVHLKPGSDWTQVSVAASALQRLPVENVLPHVEKLLSAQDSVERIFAIQVLQGMSLKPADKDPLLIKLLEDSNVEVVHAVINALLDGNPVGPQVVNKLRELLTSPEPSQVIFAAQAVTQVDRRRVGQPLRDADRQLLTTLMPDVLKAMDRDDPIQSAIRRTLESIPAKDKLPGLKAALQSDDPAVGERAEELIKKIEDKQTRR